MYIYQFYVNPMGIVRNRLFQPPRTPSTGDLFVGLRNNPQLSAALAAGDEAIVPMSDQCGQSVYPRH